MRERLEWLEDTLAFARVLAAAPIVPPPAWAKREREVALAAAAERAAKDAKK